jgi:hypothetical protein
MVDLDRIVISSWVDLYSTILISPYKILEPFMNGVLSYGSRGRVHGFVVEIGKEGAITKPFELI